MKTLSKAVLWCALVLLTQSGGQAQSPPPFDAEYRSRVANGISDNDPRAFEAALRLPVDQAVEILGRYVNDAPTNEQRAMRARETLRKMPGFSAYTKQYLLEQRGKLLGEYQVVGDFLNLGIIGGDGAAAAAAPFLFVEDVPPIIMDDVRVGSFRAMAGVALTDMHLPDAPEKKDELEAWKAWAEKKGYRDPSIPPLITLQQKGASAEIIARTEAEEAFYRQKQELMRSSGATPQAPASANPSPKPTRSMAPAISPPATPANQTPAAASPKRGTPLWPWAICILGLLVVAVIVLKRRRG